MLIKQITLDGFKSYASRTVITGFDANFNAITGLNGSGKSNILDAICFVLGISQLSKIRVNNLQELVYKQGQARVTKASVTIIFDNSFVKDSPPGYEQYKEITVTRQVVIGGRNRYIINGIYAQASRVQTLFHSVQLNINNPHFLIMQGRITEVLGMKPIEILGMIEEAAGTRMYELKKTNAKRTIERKQHKLDEIDQILKEEINPQLEKLQKEKSHFTTWSANNTEIERLTRFDTAFRFHRACFVKEKGEEEREKLERIFSEAREQSEALEIELQEIDESVETMKKDKEKVVSDERDFLDKEVNDISKELVRNTTILEHKRKALTEDRKSVKELSKSILKAEASLQEKLSESKESSGRYDEMESEHKQLCERVATLQSQQLGISMSANDGSDKGTLAQQLMKVQRTKADIESAIKKLHLRSKHIKSAIKQKERELDRSKSDHKRAQSELDHHENDLKRLETKLKKMNVDPKRKEFLENEIHRLEDIVSNVRTQIEQLRSSLSRVTFDYRSPNNNFDRSRVRGLFAKLFHVNDVKYATALETAAGGRLYEIVVDTQETGKLLLKFGHLQRRVTLIPLDKVSGRCLSNGQVKNAKDIVGQDNVCLALDLISYESELEPIMRYGFGQTLVCPDMDMAKRVTFSKNVNARTVTWDGDCFDPRGFLTGGSKSQGGSVLTKLARLSKLEQVWENESKQLEQCKAEFAAVSQGEAQAESAISKVELARHQSSILEQRIEQSAFAQIQKDISDKNAECKQIDVEISEAQTDLRKTKESAAELKRSIEDFEKEKDRKSKQVQQEIAEGKKAIQKFEKNLKDVHRNAERNELETKRLQTELSNQNEQKNTTEKQVDVLEKDYSKAENDVAEVKEKHDRAVRNFKEFHQRIEQFEKEIRKKVNEQTSFRHKLEKKQIDVKKQQNELHRFEKSQSDAKNRIEALERDNDWIQTEKHLFGKKNTDYDFEATHPNHAAKRLETLQQEQQEISARINKKVLAMFDKAEQEYSNLMKKRKIVLNDKKKIENVMDELDRKKKETLEKTWRKVNSDFGSIFSNLLPGTKAKLVAVNPESVLEGVEVRVAFGDSWKESLTELSGGQRSLLALSLILSLLLFKPAPMYILDEIDAALDLSHTQNIGRMLKTHFAKSQFIVVSLKEGMFNNANVVFKTSFSDGISKVSRTVPSHQR